MSKGLTIMHNGFVKTESYFNNLRKANYRSILDKCGKKGVEALRNATPKDTGLTSESWSYEIVSKNDNYEIVWKNSNAPEGVSVAILIQYGHASQNGTYVSGIDYINPALKPIFEELSRQINEEVVLAHAHH